MSCVENVSVVWGGGRGVVRSFLVALLEGEWDCSDVSPGFWLGLTACKCLKWGDAAGGVCGLTEVPHPVVPKGEFVHGG